MLFTTNIYLYIYVSKKQSNTSTDNNMRNDKSHFVQKNLLFELVWFDNENHCCWILFKTVRTTRKQQIISIL